jgi:hypothetical protein
VCPTDFSVLVATDPTGPGTREVTDAPRDTTPSISVGCPLGPAGPEPVVGGRWPPGFEVGPDPPPGVPAAAVSRPGPWPARGTPGAARVCVERRFEVALIDVGVRNPQAVLEALDLRGRRMRRAVILFTDERTPTPPGVGNLGMEIVPVDQAAAALFVALRGER